MRLFIFLFLTVTSLNIAEAQNTGCLEDLTIYRVSLWCGPHDHPEITISYGRPGDYSDLVTNTTNDSKVLLFLLRVQRTEPDKYTPDEIKNLVQYLVLNVHLRLWEDLMNWRTVLPRESRLKMGDFYIELREILYAWVTDDKGVSRFDLVDLSQSKLDEIHDWLVRHRIGSLYEGGPLANNCPITGDLSPLLESTQECAEWNP